MKKPPFRIFAPTDLTVTALNFRKLQPAMYAKLFADMKREMLAASNKPEGERSFQWIAESDVSDKPVAWEFRWNSPTAARVIWARPVEDGKTPDLQAVSVLWTRMDGEAENERLDSIRDNPHLANVDPASYEALKAEQGPVVGTFFVNEEALRDSLIHALIQMSAAAFFDQFGMAGHGKVVRINFDGMLFVPEGSEGQFQPTELRLPEQQQQEMFDQFSAAVKEGSGFAMTLAISGDNRPITIRFTHVGQTAAFFMLSYDVDNDPKHIHGLTALLPKLDREEDAQAIAHVRKYAALRGIKHDSFEIPLTNDKPVSATFFADLGSANYPPLHNVIKALSAAFFDQFGIVSEEEE